MLDFKLYLYNKSDNTKKTYINGINDFINYMEDNNFQSFDVVTIQNYVNHLKVNKESNTIKIRFYAIKQYANFLKIKINFNEISLPKSNNDLSPKIITQNQIDRIEKKIINKQYLIIFLMLNELGMRRSEVFNLRNIDINLNDKIIHIRNTKGNKSRKLPITLKINRAINNYKIPDLDYDRYFKIKNIESINQFFKRIDINIKPHMFRHTFITNLIKNKKIDLITVQAISGHCSVDILKTYYRPNFDDIRDIII